MSTTHVRRLPALVLALLAAAGPAAAQDARTMDFLLIGQQQGALNVKAEYYDPSELDARLKGCASIFVRQDGHVYWRY